MAQPEKEAGRDSRMRSFASLYTRIIYIRWLVPPLVFLASAIHEMLLSLVMPRTEVPGLLGVPVLVYGITGSIVAWWGLGRLAQMAIEREQAQEELQAAYDQLAETHRQFLAMHDIGKEIASAEDLQHVLEVAARAPLSLVNARGSTVVTFDEEQERLQLDVAWGLGDEYVQRLRKRLDEGVHAERCRTCSVLSAHVDGTCPLFDGLQEIAKQNGIHSLACLPFGRGKKREGIITAYFPTQEGPPEDYIRVLNIVATEIGSALESARLRHQQMEAIYALEHLQEHTRDVTPLLSQILDITLQGWNIRRGAIFLVEDKSLESHPRVQRHLEGEGASEAVRFAHWIGLKALQDAAPYVVPDVRLLDENVAKQLGIYSAVASPLVVGQEIKGVLVMFADTGGYFRASHTPFLMSIGYHAGLSLSHAELRSRVEQMAVIEERYRLSREIHDGLAQTLSVLGWRLDRVVMLLKRGEQDSLEKELEDIRQDLRAAYLDVREAIDGLRMKVTHPEGVRGALAEYVRDFSERTGIDARFVAEGSGPIPGDIGVQLLRIVQEGLTNVRKHAQARHVEVHIKQRPGEIELRIDDDGLGFDMSVPLARSRVGLSSMRERVQKLGGSITMASQPGEGVHILVTVPAGKSPLPKVRVSP